MIVKAIETAVRMEDGSKVTLRRGDSLPDDTPTAEVDRLTALGVLGIEVEESVFSTNEPRPLPNEPLDPTTAQDAPAAPRRRRSGAGAEGAETPSS